MAVIYLYGEPVLVCGGCGAEAPQRTWADAAVCQRCWEWLRDQMLLRKAGDAAREKRRLREFLMERDGGCRYCGTTEGAMTLDHVIPKSRGGILTPWNACIACHSCNQAKANRTLGRHGLKMRPLEVTR